MHIRMGRIRVRVGGFSREVVEVYIKSGTATSVTDKTFPGLCENKSDQEQVCASGRRNIRPSFYMKANFTFFGNIASQQFCSEIFMLFYIK